MIRLICALCLLCWITASVNRAIGLRAAGLPLRIGSRCQAISSDRTGGPHWPPPSSGPLWRNGTHLRQKMQPRSKLPSWKVSLTIGKTLVSIKLNSLFTLPASVWFRYLSWGWLSGPEEFVNLWGLLAQSSYGLASVSFQFACLIGLAMYLRSVQFIQFVQFSSRTLPALLTFIRLIHELLRNAKLFCNACAPHLAQKIWPWNETSCDHAAFIRNVHL